jgi:RimJ/RimL family protein N-acetyltransferase
VLPSAGRRPAPTIDQSTIAVVAPIRTPRLDLVPIAPEVIRHLVAGKRDDAQVAAGMAFPPEFPSLDDLSGFLPIQLHRMETEPAQRQWMARFIVVREPDLQLAGHCGFHGPPATIGRAEIGYTVFTAVRGRGYAREAAAALVEWAFAQGENEVFASVSPANTASLAVVRALGFEPVGEQIDDVDGIELVFVARRA